MARSAVPSRADIDGARVNVRYGPTGDIVSPLWYKFDSLALQGIRNLMLTNLRGGRGLILLYFVFLLALSAGRAFANDEQVWAALSKGGKVILLRHTHVDMREGIGRLAPGNCAEEVNLSPSGIEQAKRIGEAFRAHGVSVGEVLTSPYCRCIDTGTLAFGRATPVQYLRPPGTVSEDRAKLDRESVIQQILKHHGPSNLIMITHDLNIADLMLEDTVPMGEFFVVQPKGSDFDIIGKIRLNNQ